MRFSLSPNKSQDKKVCRWYSHKKTHETAPRRQSGSLTSTFVELMFQTESYDYGKISGMPECNADIKEHEVPQICAYCGIDVELFHVLL